MGTATDITLLTYPAQDTVRGQKSALDPDPPTGTIPPVTTITAGHDHAPGDRYLVLGGSEESFLEPPGGIVWEKSRQIV